MTFDAAADTPYRLWLRVKAVNNSKFNDSVSVQFSDALADDRPMESKMESWKDETTKRLIDRWQNSQTAIRISSRPPPQNTTTHLSLS